MTVYVDMEVTTGCFFIPSDAEIIGLSPSSHKSCLHDKLSRDNETVGVGLGVTQVKFGTRSFAENIFKKNLS